MATNSGEGTLKGGSNTDQVKTIIDTVVRISKEVVASKAFVPGVIVFVALTTMFHWLFGRLPDLWNSEDGYYSHGWLVPFISGYIIYRWWPWLKELPVRPSYWALLPLIPTFWVLFAGVRIQQVQIVAVAFLMTIMAGVWFVAGFRWLLALLGPILYLGFMLPLWSNAIDNNTNQLQQTSTDVAYGLLEIFGFKPMMGANTIIYLNKFTLDVGIPCSGLKLVLAVTAFTCFFVLIGRLKLWANALMFAFILPLCLFINGLRIALIGVVGELYGSDAGHKFHDYSGYITLIICFYILFKFARLLGWKD